MFLVLAMILCSSIGSCQLNDTALDNTATDDTTSVNITSVNVTPEDIALGEDLNTSDLKALLVNSSVSLESYRFLLDMDQTTELVNLSDSANEPQKLVSRSIGVGAVNMTDRALKLVMAAVTLPIGDERNATAMGIDEYLINDTLYLRLDGNWTRMIFPFSEDMWSQRNTLEQQVELINSSDITLLGVEEVDGVDCYKIKADMDMASFAAQLSQTDSYLPMQPLNFSSLFNNATLEAYYWIAEETHLLKKSEVNESLIFGPQDIGLPPKGPENLEMRVNAYITIEFDGYNESIEIDLPAEARGAEALPLNTTQPAEEVQLAEVAENENENTTLKA